MKPRFVLNVEAKFVVSPVNKRRFLVVRYPRDTGGYSYHYFSAHENDVLRKEEARPSIRVFLDLSNANQPELDPYYDQIWDESVNLTAVKRLRASMRDRKAPA